MSTLRVEFDPVRKFKLPFESVALNEDGSFEYYLTPRLRLSFFNLVVVTGQDMKFTTLKDLIIATNLFENAKVILRTRINMFRDHQEDRVKRYFNNLNKTLFFDTDHAFRLEELFVTHYMIADVSVVYDGKDTELKKLKPSDQAKVIQACQTLGIVYEMNPVEYRDYMNIKKYRYLKKRSDLDKKGGVETMSRFQLMVKVAGGALIMAAGSVALITGGLTIQKAVGSLIGLDKEVILVSDDFSEEAAQE